MRYRRDNDGGFTLIELMAAVFFLGAAALAVYFMFVHGQALIAEQFHRRIALEKAQQRMERIKFIRTAAPDGVIPRWEAGSGVDTLMVPTEKRGMPVVATYELVIQPSAEINAQGNPEYYSVEIKYEWTELSGRQYEIKLASRF